VSGCTAASATTTSEAWPSGSAARHLQHIKGMAARQQAAAACLAGIEEVEPDRRAGAGDAVERQRSIHQRLAPPDRLEARDDDAACIGVVDTNRNPLIPPRMNTALKRRCRT
jgi:hypothetical protein